jgi:hypothetical protein
MPRKIYKPEEIVAKLRRVEVLTSQGKSKRGQVRLPASRSVGPILWRSCAGSFGGFSVLFIT